MPDLKFETSVDHVNNIQNYHTDFNDETADICFKSSDGVAFLIHRNNLNAHSSIFPPLRLKTVEIVELPEASRVIEILFWWIYPIPPYPNLMAVTAEKYQFLGLMAVCDLLMEPNAAEHPAAVLKYAALRSDEDLADRVAIYTLSLDTTVAVKEFDGDLFKRWVLFRECWIFWMRNITPESGVTFSALQTSVLEWLKTKEHPTGHPVFSITSPMGIDEWKHSGKMKGKLVARMLRS
ncbi:hypothetical protein BDZ89DRAFT_1069422 [Hymenopellis radicata]|nr:hypothetical protein BDZ89DRAFT_1069422 [Hymenopellis radicata]